MTTQQHHTPEPAPRQETNRPGLYHRTRYTDPSGTPHTYCGLPLNKPIYGKDIPTTFQLCPACDMADFLYSLEL